MSIFWEIPSGYVVFSASWFDSGYMLFPVYGGFCTRILRSILVLLSCSVFAAKSTGKLDCLVPRSCRQRHWYAWPGFAGVDALRAMFPSLFPYTAQCLVLSGTCYASVLGWILEEFHDFLREGVAVKIPQVQFLVVLLTCPIMCMSKSSTSLSWRRGRFPWNQTTVIPQLQSVDKVVDVSLVQVRL